MNIGSNIRQLRKQKGLTQEQVAERLGISYQAVSKWESGANTPDITLLPPIAELFGVSIDALFSERLAEHSNLSSYMKDDGVIRIIQMRGNKIIKVSPVLSPDTPPIEIAFPQNCNGRTQYFKVEVYGHIVSDGSINGDVICHQSIQCGAINGDVKCDGNIKASELNAQKLTCDQITECYRLTADRLECAGDIHTVHLTTPES